MIDWFANNLWAVWLLTAITLAIIEMFSLDFFCLMLATASAATIASTVVTDSLALQVVIFAVLSLLLLLLVRPKLINKVHKNSPDLKTNTSALIGQQVQVLETVTKNAGLVRLAGDIWTARTQSSDIVISAGSYATAVLISGATVYVDPEQTEVNQ